jgi:hypothetical protein
VPMVMREPQTPQDKSPLKIYSRFLARFIPAIRRGVICSLTTFSLSCTRFRSSSDTIRISETSV